MGQPDIDKQIVIYPVGGIDEQTIDPAMSRHEALTGLNLDYRGKTGAVMKRHPVNIVSAGVAPINELSLYMFKLGDDIFQITGKHDESGVFIETRLYKLTYRPSEQDYVWQIVAIPPDEGWGIEMEIPQAIVDDSALYKAVLSGVERHYRYIYLLNRSSGENENRNRVLIRYESPDHNIVVNSVGALEMHNVINLGGNTLLPLTVTGAEMALGYYMYNFIHEDAAGNIGSFWKDIPYYWQQEGEGYCHLTGNQNAVNISIPMPDEAMPGLSKIHIFRSKVTQEFPEQIDEEPEYYYFHTIQVPFSSRPYTAQDTKSDNDLGDEWTAYWNAGQRASNLIPPKYPQCGVEHLRRMILAHENSLYVSLANKFRNYHPDDVTTLTKVGNVCELNSGYNQLNIFAEDSIWIWPGRSPAEMDVVKPKKIWDNGIPFVDMYDYKWHDTVRTWGQRTLFVDKDGWPRQIIGDRVLYLSPDGNKAVYIEPTDRINATVVGNTYRITNGKKCWVCFLDKGNAWFEWDVEILRYLLQSYDGSVNRGDHWYRGYDSIFLRNFNAYGQGNLFNDDGYGRIAIWKTGFMPVPGSEWVSLGFKIYRPNEEYTNVKDWGEGGSGGGGTPTPTKPEYPDSPEPPDPPPEPGPKQVIGIEVFLDNELDPKFNKTLQVTLNDPDPATPDRYGEQQYVHFKLTTMCERLSVKAIHYRGAEFELNRVGVTPRGTQ